MTIYDIGKDAVVLEDADLPEGIEIPVAVLDGGFSYVGVAFLNQLWVRLLVVEAVRLAAEGQDHPGLLVQVIDVVLVVEVDHTVPLLHVPVGFVGVAVEVELVV